jgi:hypothetical protein
MDVEPPEPRVFRVSPNEGNQNSREFQNVQARLRGGGRAPSMEEIARNGQQYPSGGSNDNRYPNDNRNPQQNDNYARGSRVTYPSTSYQTAGNSLFRAPIPSNWRQLGGDQNSVTYAPEGAYGSQGITHGVMFGTDREQYTDLQRAAQQYVSDLLQAPGNSYLRQQSGLARTTIAGRNAMRTTLSGRSPITGRVETVFIVVTMLRSGDLFYIAEVAPSDEWDTYRPAFENINRSLQINDN